MLPWKLEEPRSGSPQLEPLSVGRLNYLMNCWMDRKSSKLRGGLFSWPCEPTLSRFLLSVALSGSNCENLRKKYLMLPAGGAGKTTILKYFQSSLSQQGLTLWNWAAWSFTKTFPRWEKGNNQTQAYSSLWYVRREIPNSSLLKEWNLSRDYRSLSLSLILRTISTGLFYNNRNTPKEVQTSGLI